MHRSCRGHERPRHYLLSAHACHRPRFSGGWARCWRNKNCSRLQLARFILIIQIRIHGGVHLPRSYPLAITALDVFAVRRGHHTAHATNHILTSPIVNGMCRSLAVPCISPQASRMYGRCTDARSAWGVGRCCTKKNTPNPKFGKAAKPVASVA